MMTTNFSIFAGRLGGLFGLALLGWTLGRLGRLKADAAQALAHLVVDVTLPALIFVGISTFSMAGLPWPALLGAGFGLSCLGLALAWPFSRSKNVEFKGTFMFLVAVANSSFLPLPLASAIWGQEGTQYCLIYILGNNIFLLTIGIMLLQHDRVGHEKSSLTELFRHPQILAAVGALLWKGSGLETPDWASWTLNSLGQTTIPLAMVAIGALLGTSDGNSIGNKWVLGTVVGLRLLAAPALVLLGLKMIGIKGVLAGLVLLQAAMPSLASTAAYASRFGGDPVLGGKGSFWTSLGSLATLPLFLALGRLWGLY
jgi:predicted permease